jgi:hypothetical protein
MAFSVVPRTSNHPPQHIKPGPAWCEGCGEWIDTRREPFERHRRACPQIRHVLVDASRGDE